MLREKFVKSGEVEEVLELGFITDENVVLYGKGGFGKSEMSLEFLKSKGITPFVKTLGQGTQIEDMFGGIDHKHYNATDGEIQYLVTNSFMNHEYVILEEAFDASPNVLERLKDILSSGVFRNGNQMFTIKTKMIIVCTNRSKNEIAVNDSLKALMERFPLSLEVRWKTHNQEDYRDLFLKVLKDPMEGLASLLAEVHKRVFISPRMALKAATVYSNKGEEGLRFLGIPKNIIDEYKYKLKEAEEITEQRAHLTRCANIIDKAVNHSNPVKSLRALRDVRHLLHSKSYHDAVYGNFESLINQIDAYRQDILENIENS